MSYARSISIPRKLLHNYPQGISHSLEVAYANMNPFNPHPSEVLFDFGLSARDAGEQLIVRGPARSL